MLKFASLLCSVKPSVARMARHNNRNENKVGDSKKYISAKNQRR